jgi:hypothetical protein
MNDAKPDTTLQDFSSALGLRAGVHDFVVPNKRRERLPTEDFLASLGVPHLERFVRAAAGQVSAVKTEGNAYYNHDCPWFALVPTSVGGVVIK